MGRSYTIDGIDMPSVTSVLGTVDKSDALIPWAVRQCTKFIRENKGNRESYPTLDRLLESAENNWRTVRNEAADTGTQAHNEIEEYIKRGVIPSDTPAFTAFKSWEEQHGVIWKRSELTVHHPGEFYAGTLDAVCLFEGKPYVIDFKTSNGFYDTFGMQIAAYGEASKAWGVEIEGGGILRLDKTTGLPEWRDYSHRMARDYAAFLHLLDFWYSVSERKLKNNPRIALGRIPRRQREKFDARTIQQNRYYRALCRIIMSHSGHTMEEVHDFFRGLFHYKSIIIAECEMKSLLSTTTLDIDGMGVFIEKVLDWQRTNKPEWHLPTVEEWMEWDKQQTAKEDL